MVIESSMENLLRIKRKRIIKEIYDSLPYLNNEFNLPCKKEKLNSIDFYHAFLDNPDLFDMNNLFHLINRLGSTLEFIKKYLMDGLKKDLKVNEEDILDALESLRLFKVPEDVRKLLKKDYITLMNKIQALLSFYKSNVTELGFIDIIYIDNLVLEGDYVKKGDSCELQTTEEVHFLGVKGQKYFNRTMYYCRLFSFNDLNDWFEKYNLLKPKKEMTKEMIEKRDSLTSEIKLHFNGIVSPESINHPT